MPLVSAGSPAGLRRGAAAQVGALGLGGTISAKALSEGGGARAADPLPIYSLPIDALAEARSLEDALHRGWRVLTERGGVAQLVDYSGALPEGPPTIVRREPAAAMFKQAGKVASAAGDDGHEYQPRIIEFAALGISALWLHSKDSPDRVITIEPEPKTKSEADFVALAAARARKRIDMAQAMRYREGGGGSNEAGG